MLLTGFDAPVEQVMYLDKVVVAHSLLQAIARVNRVGGESKDKGFVVDYVGECQASCRQKLMHRCHPVSWSERRQYHFRHRFPVPGLAAPSFRVSGTRHLVCLITLP